MSSLRHLQRKVRALALSARAVSHSSEHGSIAVVPFRDTAGFSGNSGPCTPVVDSLASETPFLDFSTPDLMVRGSSGDNVAPVPRKTTSDAAGPSRGTEGAVQFSLEEKVQVH